MYFWRTVQLASDLKEGVVSDTDKRNYLVAWSVIAGLAGYAGVAAGAERSPLLVVECLATVVITVFGIVSCHDANQRGDGQSFLERFVCLSVPLTIRLAAALVAFIAIYAAVGTAVWEDRFEERIRAYSAVDLLFVLAFEAAFYWRLRLHILRIAGVPTREPPGAPAPPGVDGGRGTMDA